MLKMQTMFLNTLKYINKSRDRFSEARDRGDRFKIDSTLCYNY